MMKAGFRLQYLELYNWGTFNDKIWRIEPNSFNSLLTGDIGSGKSTIVDALTTLIVLQKNISYNKAAGADSKERNLRSYIKGEYKKERIENSNRAKEIFLRPEENTKTIIIANFFNESISEHLSLAIILWLKDDKPNKLYITSSKALTIKEIPKFTDPADLKKQLKKFDHIELYDDNYSKYSERFRRVFGMTSDKAIDLFNQTISMKSVTSLTDFVKEHMLEKTDIKQSIDTLKKRFEDLDKAYKEVVKSKEQLAILNPLVESATAYKNLTTEMEELYSLINSLPYYFAEKKIEFQKIFVDNESVELNKLQNQFQEIEKKLKDLRTSETEIQIEIGKNGGDRLKAIEKEMEDATIQKEIVFKASEDYSLKIELIGLPLVNTENGFYDNLKNLNGLQSQSITIKEQLREQRTELAIKLRGIENSIKDDENELKSLKQRKSQIPEELISIRQQITEDLNLELSDLPFIGELLKVRDEESEWEGAIEKLLNGFGKGLIVHPENYKIVSHYINSKTLKDKTGKRQLIEYNNAIHDSKNQKYNSISDASVVNKLEIKDEPKFDDWLQKELQTRFNIKCVELDEFQAMPNVITKEGQVKFGYTRHRKDDRRDINDKRYYILGWSNAEKIRAYENEILKLSKQQDELKAKIKSLESDEKNNDRISKYCDELLKVTDYSQINFQKYILRINELEQQFKALKNSSNILRTLEQQLKDLQTDIGANETQKTNVTGKIAVSKKQIETATEDIKKCSEKLNDNNYNGTKKYFDKIAELHSTKNLELKSIDTHEKEIRESLNGNNGKLKALQAKQNAARDNVNSKIKDIKIHSPSETIEMAANIDAVDEYIKFHKKVSEDDLPRHEARLENELKEKTIQGINIFDQKLQQHSIEVEDKINNINKNLKDIEYELGTYIEIRCDRVKDHQIDTFKDDLKNCYSYSIGEVNLYSTEKYEQIKKILDRFNSLNPIDTEWTTKVTDVRNWFEFNASEKRITDDVEVNYHPGSSGKSGGQKEKLAYTILASALAYQFGLSDDVKARSYRFVVIDEAFGRGSDDSTRYGLELFKKLDLQLLIVTPLQKINIIENYVNSFHFISNFEGRDSAISNLTYQEYIDQKLKNAAF